MSWISLESKNYTDTLNSKYFVYYAKPNKSRRIENLHRKCSKRCSNLVINLNDEKPPHGKAWRYWWCINLSMLTNVFFLIQRINCFDFSRCHFRAFPRIYHKTNALQLWCICITTRFEFEFVHIILRCAHNLSSFLPMQKHSHW